MNKPTHLYRYQSLSAHSLSSILNDTIWLSSPSAFNDPFDCAIPLSRNKLKESAAHAIKELERIKNLPIEKIPNHNKLLKQDEETYEILRETLRNQMSKIGVVCFSATHSEILMWSHYANNHKGFCIEYDFSENSDLRKIAKPINYCKTIPELSLAKPPQDANNNFIDVCVFTKAKQWEYEQEWRILMDGGNRVFKSPSKITSIIFASKMPSEDKVMLFKALQHKKGLEFKEANLLDEKFAIEVKTFTI